VGHDPEGALAVVAGSLVLLQQAPGAATGGQVATSHGPAGHVSSAVTPTSAAPVRTSTVRLAAPTFTPVTFPLTPGWTPSGLAAPVVDQTAGAIRLVYSGKGSTYLMASVSRALGPPDFTPSATHPTTVDGHPATLATGTDAQGNPATRITWRLADGRWVDLRGNGRITAAQTQRFADNLTNRPFPPGPLPFTFALAPEGYQVSFQELHPESTTAEYHFCLAPPRELADLTSNWICVAYVKGAHSSTEGDPVQVGPDPGTIADNRAGGYVLTVNRPGFVFSVIVNKNGPLSRDDLIRFAAGITKS
jgi:hypothetical protein